MAISPERRYCVIIITATIVGILADIISWAILKGAELELRRGAPIDDALEYPVSDAMGWTLVSYIAGGVIVATALAWFKRTNPETNPPPSDK